MWAVTVFRYFTSEVFRSMSGVFLSIPLRCIFGRRSLLTTTYEGQVNTWYQHGVSLVLLNPDHLTKAMFARFLHGILLFLHLFHTLLLMSKSLSVAHTQGRWGEELYLLEIGIYINYLEFFCEMIM